MKTFCISCLVSSPEIVFCNPYNYRVIVSLSPIILEGASSKEQIFSQGLVLEPGQTITAKSSNLYYHVCPELMEEDNG